ncbi:hypothetical protein UFOVP909_144 [uncultured Caudovirales phage]|uniref:Uncharacterized protein n=1 Tax=uncultured Caudovirales phage TaxID=2100421 RepID=A0A6J5SCH2_9CAUD|nr:hypothetical protein UFOVP909_144 [uncultured Caudovirales phage]CAB4182064.1 hypothetical protein UFOVP1066_127 [uncultured Caudovirales phage]CAB4198681.1 hypothetical protein UFOVP1315_210 [uncultured Caudovirales phage]CAB4211564.1 hypothetical protein UFOVP1421_171 [uncultured Caudovirales phage]CAB5238677.1 hypothetical protein UFOVP1525_181 [uncultured Caudovirales phage]
MSKLSAKGGLRYTDVVPRNEILQIVQGTASYAVSNVSTTFVTTGCVASIALKKPTSKLLIQFEGVSQIYTTDGIAMDFRIYKNGVQFEGAAAFPGNASFTQTQRIGMGVNASIVEWKTDSFSMIDYSGTGGKYEVWFARYSGAGSYNLTWMAQLRTITLTEISA